MSFPRNVRVSGGLFFAPQRSELVLRRLLEPEEDRQTRKLHRLGWYHIVLPSTSVTLRTEEPETGEYHFLLRISGQRFLLGSNERDLIQPFLEFLQLGLSGTARIRSPTVRIAEVVELLVQQPDVYCLSSVHAKVDGYGRALRSVSMYGDDLAEAELFQNVLPRLAPFRVGLRSVSEGFDILEIGTRGETGFFYRDESTLYAVDAGLAYLSKKRLLEWEPGATL